MLQELSVQLEKASQASAWPANLTQLDVLFLRNQHALKAFGAIRQFSARLKALSFLLLPSVYCQCVRPPSETPLSHTTVYQVRAFACSSVTSASECSLDSAHCITVPAELYTSSLHSASREAPAQFVTGLPAKVLCAQKKQHQTERPARVSIARARPDCLSGK